MRVSAFHATALIVVLAAAGLRAAPLTENRFHPDEALYATFARLIASGRDPWLSHVVVDKPPLPFYLMAAGMAGLGAKEFAARLPSFLAGLVTVAAVYQLARTLYGARAAGPAAVLLAASPLAILFAVTLFTDTLLGAFLTLSLLAVARRRYAAGGWLFGLAFACKQTALLALPLAVALAVIQLAAQDRPARTAARVALGFLLPALICAAAILAWDYFRHPPISFWTQGYSDNNPGRWVRSNEIGPRVWAWLDLMQYLTGSRLLDAAVLIALPILPLTGRRSQPALYDILLTGFCLCFLAGYWLLAFNVWDRYLVVLAPLLAVLGGRCLERGLAFVERLRPRPWRRGPARPAVAPALAVVVAAACLAPSALTAARSGFPIGGDHGAYDGIDQAAAALRTVPPGSVLYDYWLSWELGFYLFDGPAYIAWMPGPGALAADLRVFGRRSPRYIVSPSWESFAEMRQAIESAGFKAEAVRQTYRRDGSLSFTVFQIVPQ
jgi:4-amino-4-deoxy-L-arabinose transferase-like glycosyltransferase